MQVHLAGLEIQRSQYFEYDTKFNFNFLFNFNFEWVKRRAYPQSVSIRSRPKLRWLLTDYGDFNERMVTKHGVPTHA